MSVEITSVETVLLNRNGWPKGPWDAERFDRKEWIDQDTGFQCMICRGPLGNWCGYDQAFVESEVRSLASQALAATIIQPCNTPSLRS